METYTVEISGNVTLSLIEKIMSCEYDKSIRSAKSNNINIEFDLSKIEWVGFFPACLVYTWLSILRQHNKLCKINVKLPSRSEINPQVKKVLINYGIVSKFEDLKINCSSYTPGDYPDDGLPFNVIESKEKLFDYLQDKCNNFINKIIFYPNEKEIIRSTFEIIIFELVENTFNHAGGVKPYFGISYAKSSGSKNTKGFMVVFDHGTPYIEFAIGDIGVGLDKELIKKIDNDYAPPFDSNRKFNKYEKTIFYSMEFSTTRDYGARKKRINELIGNKEIDPLQIATGLFCVNEMAKNYQGQLVVRTPRAILSIDYYRESGIPTIMRKMNIGVNKLSPIQGTHYLLRIPLVQKEITNKLYKPIPILGNISVNKVQPFSDDSIVYEDFGKYLLDSFHKIESHLYKYRKTAGITLILPPPLPLNSRALSVFITAIKAMSHGRRLVIWGNSRAYRLFNSDMEGNSNYYFKPKDGSLLLIGDIINNKFVLLGNTKNAHLHFCKINSESDRDLSFEQNVFKIIQLKYFDYLDQYLKKILNNNSVLYTNGSFLVEKKYYTKKFYHISPSLHIESNIRRFSEWFSYHVKDKINLIIVTSEDLLKIANEMSAILSTGNHIISTLLIGSPVNPANAAQSIVPYIDKTVVILTDVICRGENINQMLSIISPLNHKKIFCLVDARHKVYSGKPISYLKNNEHNSVDVVSIVKDEITSYVDPPLADKIYIIDKTTKAPTLYVRPSIPKQNIDDALRHARINTSLFLGHFIFDKRHYSCFLHLPRLLDAYQNEIKVWINDQVEYISQTSNLYHDEWESYTFNPRGNLTWSEKVLDLLPSNISHYVITKEDLLAPKPPSEHKSINNNILIFLPAIASGETVRLCIEYVSRKNPDNILVMCFLSRMDPYHRTFFSGIDKYRDANIYFSFFLDLTINAYENESNCPICTYNSLIKTLYTKIFNLSTSLAHNYENLLEILGQKYSSQLPIKLEYSNNGFISESNLSDNDVKISYLRSLYEGSERDIAGARKLLNKLLAEHTDNLDNFLEILSLEKYSRMFTYEELDSRLYNTYNLLINRSHDILNESCPPFKVGKYVSAIAYLIPTSFLNKCCDLIVRYIDSKIDIYEIVLNILCLDKSPTLSDDLFRICREKNMNEIESILTQVHSYFKISKNNEKINYDNTVQVMASLWSRFARSNYYLDSLKPLYVLSQNKIPDYYSLLNNSEYLISGWKTDVSIEISKLHQTPIWVYLSQKHPNIGNTICELDRGIAKYEQLITIIFEHPNAYTKQLENIRFQIIQIYKSSEKFRLLLGKFFINPVKCSANSYSDVINTSYGERLRFIKDIDQFVPKVFCTMKELDFVCDQIVENWQKHKTTEKYGTTVIFKLYLSLNSVCMEFIDDIEGDFVIESQGGLKIVSDFCSQYGCTLSTYRVVDSKFKSLKLMFIAVDI